MEIYIQIGKVEDGSFGLENVRDLELMSKSEMDQIQLLLIQWSRLQYQRIANRVPRPASTEASPITEAAEEPETEA